MGKKIKREEISEATRWVFDCPSCGEFSESVDDISDGEITCEHCSASFEIE